MEANNLLQSEISGLDSRIKWIETDVIKIRDLVSMLKRSVETDVDESVKTVLSIVGEDCERILVNDIPDLNKVITKIEKLSEVQETKPRQRRSSTNRKPRTKKEESVVDIVDTMIEKDKQAANE